MEGLDQIEKQRGNAESEDKLDKVHPRECMTLVAGLLVLPKTQIPGEINEEFVF